MSLPILAAAFGLLFHFGSKEVKRFENMAAGDLASHLEGDAKQVKVRIKLGSLRPGHLSEATIEASGFSTKTLPLWTEPRRSKEGRIDKLIIKLKDFEIGGLPMESLNIELNDCRWDFACAVKEGKIRLSRSGSGTFQATISQDGIVRYLAKRYPFVKTSSFRIETYKILFSGSLATPLGTAPFDLVAVPRLHQNSGLSLIPVYLSFSGVRTDISNEPALRRVFDPVIDVNRDFGLRGALEIESLELGLQSLGLRGKATIPAIAPTEQQFSTCL